MVVVWMGNDESIDHRTLVCPAKHVLQKRVFRVGGVRTAIDDDALPFVASVTGNVVVEGADPDTVALADVDHVYLKPRIVPISHRGGRRFGNLEELLCGPTCS